MYKLNEQSWTVGLNHSQYSLNIRGMLRYCLSRDYQQEHKPTIPDPDGSLISIEFDDNLIKLLAIMLTGQQMNENNKSQGTLSP